MTTDQLQQIVDFVHEAEEMLVEHNGNAVDPPATRGKMMSRYYSKTRGFVVPRAVRPFITHAAAKNYKTAL